MKKLIRLFVCAFAMICVFASCSKDVETAIVGEWHATKSHYTQKKDGAILHEEEENFAEGVRQAIMVFNEDKTIQLIYVNGDGDREVTNGTWVYADEKLIITEKDGEEEYTETMEVQTLTKKELVLVNREIEENEDGKWEYISTAYFTKK